MTLLVVTTWFVLVDDAYQRFIAKRGKPLRASGAEPTFADSEVITVSLIVEQLMNERWIVEGGVAQLPRGRKPRLLTLDVEKAGIIGVNAMTDVTTLVLADLNSSFRAQESFATPGEPERLVRNLADRIRRLMELHPETAFEAIGVSVPGRVDRRTQRLVFAPNLGWRDVDLKTALEEATKLPVSVENAANACALAELWSARHGEHVSHLVAVTVSEGIGVGMVMNGQLVRGSTGVAGEGGPPQLGHRPRGGSGPVVAPARRGADWAT